MTALEERPEVADLGLHRQLGLTDEELDAIRFGDPADPWTRHLVDGVVRGVGGYGNCVGVPTVGGELVFDSSYQGNPLVNVMAIGLLDERMLTRAVAPGPGNLMVLFGSTTGRAGIG